ncbi:VOC family protein, partial [Streptomyces sp. NPDC056159]|uniref:VOC family protein n=1 Tax=Streptomyces sp. NPDC056159 TaxID=3155537 RepID=UPI00341834B3
MSAIKKFQVTFDCAEPERLARFWCEVLGYVVPPPPEGFATWDDFKRSQPPEQRDSWFACSDPSGVAVLRAAPGLADVTVVDGPP